MLHEMKRKKSNDRLDESINDEKDGIQKISLEIASEQVVVVEEEEAEAEREGDRSKS